MVLQVLIFALSLTLSLLFFLYGFNHYFLLNAARSYQAPAPPENSLVRPAVSLQLPVYNEKYVVRRLVTACTVMAETYGIEKVKILILDDSDDDTVQEIDKVVQEYRQKHFQIEVLRRNNRNGYKAGALQAALNQTEEEFIAIFDADFTPSADFLLRTLPYFDGNETLGIVQTRWTFLNRDSGLVARAISHGIDVHFLVEQPGRYAAGLFQNFNGSGGVLRKKAIREAGGWQTDTLAEDLDLSYRMQMLGYSIIYLKDVLCPGEIPPTIPSFKLQQGRWACGTFKTAIKILPGLLQNRKLGFKQRLQAFIHLTGYLIQPLMVISFILGCISALFGVNSYHAMHANSIFPTLESFLSTKAAGIIFIQDLIWIFLAPFITLCTLAPWVSLVSTIKVQKLPVLRNLFSLMVLVSLCFGISLSIMRGVGRAFFKNRTWSWIRTPKYANLQNKQAWRQSKYQLPIDPLWIWELVFVVIGLSSIVSSLLQANLAGLFLLIPFTVSYGMVLVFSLLDSRKAQA
jgi:cellulose synthase/poly-beta-1,6-N-acetylglucosamine synthase-like glycosyltransferase